MPLDIRLVPYGGDNYAFLLQDAESGATACVDAGDGDAILAALEATGWRLSEIWITHHHGDHVAGLAQVKAATGARVRGPEPHGQPIHGLDDRLEHGDDFNFAGRAVHVIATPGHTLDMINFHLPTEAVVFTGDTLFTLGCGRLFEGTPEMMWHSLTRLAALPDATRAYGAHEYTAANARFALSVDPDNAALAARAAEVQAARAEGRPTVPTTIGEERATNPFLRASDPAMKAHLGMAGVEDAAAFAEIRARKDRA